MATCGKHSEVLGLMKHAARHWRRLLVLGLTAVSLAWATAAGAAETINAYSIWPENWARPMLQEFETATGIKVNFLRFSSGEALARVLAEKNNPKVDVLFGGPVETFAAGIKEGVFEACKPPAAAVLPSRFKETDGYWTAIADDPLVFMTNQKFLTENNLLPAAVACPRPQWLCSHFLLTRPSKASISRSPRRRVRLRPTGAAKTARHKAPSRAVSLVSCGPSLVADLDHLTPEGRLPTEQEASRLA